MTDIEKEGYTYAIWGSLVTLSMGVATLILLLALFQAGGISIGEFQRFQIVAAVLVGIVFPGILFALNFLVQKGILKFKTPGQMALLFGLITAIIGVILIVISAVWINFLFGYIGDPDTVGHTLAILVCIMLGIIAQIVVTYGGIQNIISWNKNK